MNGGKGGEGGGGGAGEGRLTGGGPWRVLRDSSGEGALYAPVRVVIFLLLAGALAIVFQLIAALLHVRVGGELLQLGYLTGLLCVAVLVAHRVMFRLTGVGAAGWEAVGLARSAAAPGTMATGAMVGAAAVAIPIAVLLAVGWYALEPGGAGSSGALAVELALAFLPAALWEELLARGYLFATLRERWGAPTALVVTSVGFGLLHLQNPGTNLHAVVQVTLAGFWLGGVLLATGSLYAAWMAHAAWNWSMAAGFHAPVSGLEFDTPGWRLHAAGPEWATGGAWGPEGGVFVVVTMSLTLVFLMRRRRRRGES